LSEAEQHRVNPKPVEGIPPIAVEPPIAAVQVESMGPSLLNAEDVHSELAAIDWYLGEIQEDPAHLAAIDVLASVFRDASQRALGAQWMTVHRLASACAD